MTSPARLGLGTLGRLSRATRPPIDPRALRVGIVHLGIGAFHRAHQAAFTQDAIAAAGGDWGICGVSQRSGAVRDALGPQDGLFTIVQRGAQAERLQVIASVRELLWAQVDNDAVLARIADPTTAVVTLTVTENGYRRDPRTGGLALSDPVLAGDLANGSARTVVGQLVQGLARRRSDGAPLTIVSCDNLPGNGRVLSGLVREFAGRLPGHPGLRAWIEEHVRFPCTVVDRIVPATTDADRAQVADRLGVDDRGLVVAEPFRQWVIEDDFAGPRPAWDRAGAIITDEVEHHERIKLRMLNGSHSTLAYLGALAGHELIAQAAACEPLHAVASGLMERDVAPTVRVPSGVDLKAYRREVLERLTNPALAHRTLQVCTDGSQKLPGRLLDTIAARRRAGAEPLLALLGVAAWMHLVSARRSDAGRPLGVDDALTDTIAVRLGGRVTPTEVVDALLSIGEVFPDEISHDLLVRERLIDLVSALARDGAEGTARALTA